MRPGYKDAIRILLIVLIILTVAFIFIQSAKSPERSAEDSDRVGEMVEEIIPPDTPPGEFIQINLRKIAHFVEFSVLGLEVALYVWLFARKRSFILASYPIALFVALIDETAQIFSGRGSSLSDVWLDFSGFLTTATLFYGVALLVARLHVHFKKQVE